MAETKPTPAKEVKADKVLKYDDPESVKLQNEGWVVTEIKEVDGIKMHFLNKPSKSE